MGKLLISIAGAREEILRECPTERVRFQNLGWAILITSGIATVSMWFALSSTLGVNPVLALPLALAWGLAIMGIDRWLITSIPPRGSRRILVALPRLLLAVLIGTIISTPIVLRIFQPEINNEIAKLDTQQANSYTGNQQNGQISKEVTYWQGQVTNDENVINSGGKVPLNYSSDQEIESLTSQLASWETKKQTFYNQWQCQLYGIAPDGLKCDKGNGPLARSSQQSYQQAAGQVTAIQSEITARERSLSASSVAAASTRLSEAKAALPHAQSELAGYRGEQDSLRGQYDSTLPKTGLLIRLQALSAITNGSETLDATRVLLFLLFLVIECLPVTVKLMQRPGNYEFVLEKASEHERRRALRRVRESEGLPGENAAGESAAAADDRARRLWQEPQPERASAQAQDRTTPFDAYSAFTGTGATESGFASSGFASSGFAGSGFAGSGFTDEARPRTRPDFNLRTFGLADGDDSPRTRGGSPLSFDDDDDEG